jgi:hypothetical protein
MLTNIKRKFCGASILLFTGLVLSGCGTCIGCNGKLFDANAGETYRKRVAEEKKAEEKACFDMGFQRGTVALLKCLDRFDQVRKEREAADLRRSRAIGSMFGAMGNAVMRSGQRQAEPATPIIPDVLLENGPTSYTCSQDYTPYSQPTVTCTPN